MISRIVRFGPGGKARRAAMSCADRLWDNGTPARAVFKVELGGWAVIIYDGSIHRNG
jgi:hypothetical protein